MDNSEFLNSKEVIDLSDYRDKINSPETSRGELTKIRDELKEAIHKQALMDGLSDMFVDMTLAYISGDTNIIPEDEKESEKLKKMKLLLSLTQSRINREEPYDIKEMRKELLSIEMELSNNMWRLEKIKSGDFDSIFQLGLETIKIEMSSRGISDFEQYIKSSERLYGGAMLAMIENAEKIFGTYKNLELMGIDLTYGGEIDETMTASYYDYVINGLTSTNSKAEKLVYMTMFLLTNQ